MRDFQLKSNAGGVSDSINAERFGAGEFNALAVELENAVESSDQTLAPADGTGEVSTQLAMAMAIYGAGGAAYHADTGAVNAYVLDPVSPKESPPDYFDGFTVCFEPGTVNTTASTVNVASLGVKDITLTDGTALSGGEIKNTVTIKYSSTNDRFELLNNSTILYNWEDVGNALRPIVSDNDSLGDSTHLIQDIYQADSGIHYLGSDQDAELYHDGSNFYLNTDTGLLNFQISGSSEWIISASALYPAATKANDIGTASLTVNDVYLGDSSNLYFGDSQDAFISFSGSNFLITTSAGGIFFRTDGTNNRWLVDTAGGFLPAVADTYDIGSASLEVANIYLGQSAYFGTTQLLRIYHNSTNAIITVSSGSLNLQSTASIILQNGGTTSFYTDSSNNVFVETGGLYYTYGYNNAASGPRDLGVSPAGYVGYISSAKRFKTNIIDLEDTSWLYNLRPVKFNHIEAENITEYGFIADEMAEFDDNICFYDKDDKIAGLHYRYLHAVAIKEIQRLNDRLKILEGIA